MTDRDTDLLLAFFMVTTSICHVGHFLLSMTIYLNQPGMSSKNIFFSGITPRNIVALNISNILFRNIGQCIGLHFVGSLYSFETSLIGKKE